MPRSQGTSRKGKPGKKDRDAGMGKSLQRAQVQRYRPRADGKSRRGDGGMHMQAGVDSIGLEEAQQDQLKTRSVLEMQDLDDFLLQADMANREFVSEKEGLVVVDQTGQAYRPPAVQWADQKSSFLFTELSVPRRPAWDDTTTAVELDMNERKSFLEWRRAIAIKEEELARTSSLAAATPFEKNLEVWRQLWRVLERSACLLQLVDARNPMFYLSDDLRDYASALGKPMMVLVNKSDYLSPSQRASWREYLIDKGWDPVFFSAVKEQQKLDAMANRKRIQVQLGTGHDNSLDHLGEETDVSIDAHDQIEEPEDERGVSVPLSRERLMETMLSFARQHNCQPDPRYDNRIQFGMVGFPNVGKSSVINVLFGSSKHEHGVVRVAVASQPGKTKHFQTLMLPDAEEMMLCDCPGLVFPSFVSNTADLIAAGVYPIAQMRDHWPVTNLICQRIPREVINAHYGIVLPKPSQLEMNERGLTKLPPPSGEEFLGTFCIARGMLAASSGVPDYTRAARTIIKDYADGKLLYCHPPPSMVDVSHFYRETIFTSLSNTRKLQARLVKSQLAQTSDLVKEQRPSTGENTKNLVDCDLLSLLEGPSKDENPMDDTQKSGRNMHKWGKKNRKNRNLDPYGCHGDPDEMLRDSSSAGGIVIKAGKYGRKGYTRPTSYAGARDATQALAKD
jgi:large subunit GTPase 1